MIRPLRRAYLTFSLWSSHNTEDAFREAIAEYTTALMDGRPLPGKTGQRYREARELYQVQLDTEIAYQKLIEAELIELGGGLRMPPAISRIWRAQG